MSENWGSPAEPESRKVEKERSGILAPLGALLGGLLGAVVWAAVSMLGYVTALVGFLIAWLASKGYDLLGGKPGAVKVISLIVSVVIAVAAGTLGNVVYTTHKAYGEARQEILDEYMGYGLTEEAAKQAPQANPFAQTPGNTSNHSKPPFSNDSTGQ